MSLFAPRSSAILVEGQRRAADLVDLVDVRTLGELSLHLGEPALRRGVFPNARAKNAKQATERAFLILGCEETCAEFLKHSFIICTL